MKLENRPYVAEITPLRRQRPSVVTICPLRRYFPLSMAGCASWLKVPLKAEAAHRTGRQQTRLTESSAEPV